MRNGVIASHASGHSGVGKGPQPPCPGYTGLGKGPSLPPPRYVLAPSRKQDGRCSCSGGAAGQIWGQTPCCTTPPSRAAAQGAAVRSRLVCGTMGAPRKGRASWVTPHGCSPSCSARWRPLSVGIGSQSEGRPLPSIWGWPLLPLPQDPAPAAPAGPRRLAAKPRGSAQLRHGAIFLAHNSSARCGQLPLSNIYCGFTCLRKAL